VLGSDQSLTGGLRVAATSGYFLTTLRVASRSIPTGNRAQDIGQSGRKKGKGRALSAPEFEPFANAFAFPCVENIVANFVETFVERFSIEMPTKFGTKFSTKE
jgi:hypothetical protein